MLTATASFKIISQSLDRSLKTTADKPDVKRQSDYYLAHIRDAKSIDDFLSNNRLFSYAMKAYGLQDMTFAKAFMRKVLEGGVDDPKSFANSLTDKRYREFATAFNFKRYGATATAFERAQQGTVDLYVRQTLEEQVGADDEGVRLALYFQRKAPEVTSALGLLADKALLQVTQVALGLPAATGALDIDKQVALINKKLNIADLKDPAKLQKLLTRFTSLWEAQKQPDFSTNAASLIGGSGSFGINGDVLASLQNLRLGGN